MKLVFLANSNQLYGANKSLIDLLSYLKQKKIELLVIAPSNGPFDSFLKDNNFNVKVIPFEFNYHENTFSSLIKTPFRFARRLLKTIPSLKIIKDYKPDLIYSNSSVINVGFFIAKYLKIPHIWHIRENIYSNYNLAFDFGRKFQEFLFAQSDILIANSEYTQKSKLSLVRLDKVRIIYNGVFYRDEMKQFGRRQNRIKNLAVIGLLHPYKGQLESIKIFSRLLKIDRSLVLHIVGNGNCTYTNSLKQLAVELKISDSVVFHGYIPDMEKIYRNTDLLLVHSRGEAMGRVTVEAMAFGIPVIGLRSGATTELIQDGVNGFLFSSEEEFLECCDSLVRDENLHKKLSEGAKVSALDRFTIDKYGESIYSTISTLVK